MNYKKKGYPKESELLICTVKRILPHSIFVEIDEYKDKEGYIHISEIAPGRIRNIRDYVRENKKIVCKVLAINQEKGYIDLSLRRVSDSVKLAKLEENKQEEKAERILELISKKLNITLDELYKKIESKVLDKYDLFSNFLQDISINGEIVLKSLAFSQDYSNVFLEIVKEKIKAQEVSTSYDLTLSSLEPNGVNIIKGALNDATLYSKEMTYNIKIKYISAPKYMLVITSKDYKTCEKISEELAEKITTSMKNKGKFALQDKEN